MARTLIVVLLVLAIGFFSTAGMAIAQPADPITGQGLFQSPAEGDITLDDVIEMQTAIRRQLALLNAVVMANFVGLCNLEAVTRAALSAPQVSLQECVTFHVNNFDTYLSDNNLMVQPFGNPLGEFLIREDAEEE